jgi:chemotaxis protein CheZ
MSVATIHALVPVEQSLREPSASLSVIKREIDSIGEYLGALREAINALRAPEISRERLPTMREDLAAIVATTRHAAETVLCTAEDVLASNADGPSYRSFVEDRMIGLMEACSFQDLTGQRLTRVSDALIALEQRLGTFVSEAKASNGMLKTHDVERRQGERRAQRMTAGPGVPDALAQDEIDRLLNG